MPNIDRLLYDSEEIYYQRRKHPVGLFRPALVTVISLVIASFVGYVWTPGSGEDVIDKVAGGLALLIGLRFVFLVVRWSQEVVVLTQRRVVVTSGLIARKVTSIPLARIGEASLSRTVGGRLQRYGDVVCELGGGSAIEIRRVARVARFYRDLVALMSQPDRHDTPATKTPLPVTRLDEDDTGPLPRVIL